MREHTPHGQPALELTGVTVGFNGVMALEDVSFSVPAGQLVAVVGPNGAGKSTLFHAIVGLVKIQAGAVLVHGEPPEKARRRIAFVPQQETVNWRFPITVEEVVLLGRVRRQGLLRRAGRRDREVAAEALERVGMAGWRGRPAAQLSGGQRQRVFLARALAQEADLLLLDEALSGIDAANQEAILQVLEDIAGRGVTALAATHDLTDAGDHFQTILGLNRRLVAWGPPQEVFQPEVFRRIYGGRIPTIPALTTTG